MESPVPKSFPIDAHDWGQVLMLEAQKLLTFRVIYHQGDAARVLEELDLYITALTEAAHMAIDLGSQKRYSEALLVFQKTPEKWLRERRIQKLANDVFGQLPGRK